MPAATTPIYASSIPYEPRRIRAAAIYCSDGRLADHVDEFLHNGLALPRYDRVTCPGGPVCLAGRLGAHWEALAIEEQLRFLAQVHEIGRVVLIAHAECAYYARRLAIPREHTETEQKEDLRKAQAAVRRIVPRVEVSLYFARIVDAQIVFESV